MISKIFDFLKRLCGIDCTQKVKCSPKPKRGATKVTFYIKVYPEGKSWVCEEGDVYSDGTEVPKSKDHYATEHEAEYARLMQLH